MFCFCLNNLNWDSHIQNGKKVILPSICRQLGALSTLKHAISMKGKLQLVNALLITRIAYLICIWGNTTENVLRKVQTVQNQAARFVTGRKKITRRSELISDCGWMNVSEMTKYYSLLQLWKTTRWWKPDYLLMKLQEEDDDRLSTDIPRIQLTAGSFRCKSVSQWNTMSDTLRGEQSISKFKSGLKKWIRECRSDGRGEEVNQIGNGG